MSHAVTLDAGELNLDPTIHPEVYDGVRTRRSFAFLIDAAVVLFVMVAAYLVIAVVGIFTLGLHEFITDFITENNKLGAAMAEQYLV